MSKLSGIIPVALCATLMLGQPVAAQDFDRLLDAVNKVEVNLRQLVKQEAAARQAEMASLRNDLKNGGAAGSVDLKPLMQRLDSLEKVVTAMRTQNGTANNLTTRLSELMDEIVVLQDHVDRLEAQVTPEPAMLASTDMVNDIPSPTHREAVEGPTAEPLAEGIDITGFVDAVGGYHRHEGDKTEFTVGQAELDLEKGLSDRASVAVAVAYNNESANFELGAAELGLNMYANDASFVRSLDVTAGQFDVPFGIDYLVYASIDRKLITEPWFLDLHGGWRGWNDFGVNVSADFAIGNVVAYWVNGFEESAEVIERITNLTTGLQEDTVMEVNTTPANALGTRIGITPVNGLEIGTSFAVGFNESGNDEMTLTGADVQYTVADLYVKGEYVYHSVNRSIAEEHHQGYYLQSMYSFAPAYAVVRYSTFQAGGQEWLNRLTIGGGFAVLDNLELRLETDIDERGGENETLMQLVAGF